MQVLLHTDTQIAGGQSMAAHFEQTVREELARFAGQLTRVEAHLADAGAHAKSLPDEIQCTVEARVVGLAPVVVKDAAATAHQAMHGAVAKLARALAHDLDKRAERAA